LKVSAERVEGGDGETVLVIDDEPTIRMLIADELTEHGYKIIEAEGASTGLRILESDMRIDLLITDVGLPGGINGRQVADAASVTRPELKVLFITGFAENAVVGNGRLAQGMAVLTKPLVLTALSKKIRELISR
jgi:DNA-binding response OmpR family regulator